MATIRDQIKTKGKPLRGINVLWVNSAARAHYTILWLAPGQGSLFRCALAARG